MTEGFSLPPGRLIAATHNPGKVRELKALLEPLGHSVESAIELDLAEPDEPEMTFSGNALVKARAAAQASGIVSIADDSGLEAFGLGGMPGVFSARWAGPGKDFSVAMEKVEAALKAAETQDMSARFVCALALCWPDGREAVFEGEVRGHLVFPPRGLRGFGYDPIFIRDGDTETFGEIDPDLKHRISHRADAFAKLLAALR